MARHTGFASLPLHGGKAPAEIASACEALGSDPRPLVYASRTSEKVGNAAVKQLLSPPKAQ